MVKPTLETFNREFYKNSFSANPSERVSEVDIISYLREDILKKVDVASMSASLEVRSPFLDFKIAELSALYPYEYKEKDVVRKRILTDAFAKYCRRDSHSAPSADSASRWPHGSAMNGGNSCGNACWTASA